MGEYINMLTDKSLSLKHKIYSIRRRTDIAAYEYKE